MNYLILLAVSAVLVYRATSPEDRERGLRFALGFVRDVRVAAARHRPAYDAFCAALRSRTAHAIVVPALIAVNVLVFTGMLFGPSGISEPATLARWGANIGPRTTNGEWWRLVTSMFVHTSLFRLLVDVGVLLQLGVLLERFAGRAAVAAAYVAAGVLGALVHLSAHPVAAGFAPAAAIFGLYGLLLGCLAWQAMTRPAANPLSEAPEGAASRVTIPRIAMKRLGVVAAVFVASSALGGFAGTPEWAGLAVGFAFGLAAARHASEHSADVRAVAVVAAAAMAVAVAVAIPLRNIADVKPELARVVDVEQRTTASYGAAVDRFKRGRLTADALAQLADGTIVTELQAVDARLQALVHVPPEHQMLVTDAREFLRLRGASWRARAEALRRTNRSLPQRPDGAVDARWRMQAEARFRSNLAATGHAEGAERAARAAFERVRQPL